MANKIEPGELNALMQAAGVGARTQRKMHQANGTAETPTAEPKKPKGHGAPEQSSPRVSAL